MVASDGFTERVWPNSAEVLPAAFAGSGLTVVAFRPHSVEPSGHGFLYGYEVDTVDSVGTTATVLTFIDTDARAVDGSSVLTRDPVTGQPLAVGLLAGGRRTRDPEDSRSNLRGSRPATARPLSAHPGLLAAGT